MSMYGALEETRSGRSAPVFDSDDRGRGNGPTIASGSVVRKRMRTMRREVGGPVCAATPCAEGIGLHRTADGIPSVTGGEAETAWYEYIETHGPDL